MKKKFNGSSLWKAIICSLVIGIGILGIHVQPSYAHRPHDVIEQIVISPDYAQDQTLMIVVRGNLYKSNDGGQNWRRMVQGFDRLYPGSTPITDMTLAPTNKNHFFVATAWNGIYKSEDGGESWFSVNEGLPIQKINDLSTWQIHKVAVSPTSENDVLAALTQGGLYLSQDGGQKWQPIFDKSQKFVTIAFTPNSNIIVIDDQGKLLRSDDLGKNWQTITILSPDNKVNRIAVSPQFTQDNTIFLATDKEGVLKTTDGGKTFTPINQGIKYKKDKSVQDIVLSPNYAQDETLAIVNWHEGAFISQDDGQTWQRVSQGLSKDHQADDFKVPHFNYIRFSPNVEQDQTLFVGAFDGLFKTTNQGKKWQEVETLSTGTIMALGVSPNYAEDDTLAIATYVGNIYRSQDKGETWQPINKGLERPLFDSDLNPSEQAQDPRRYYDLAFSPNYESDQTFWASILWDKIVKTANQGDSWQRIRLPSPAGRGPTFAVSPNFSEDQTLFVISQEGHFYRSTNAGNNFRKIGKIERAVGNDPSSIVISPNFAVDKTLYAVGKGGVFQSTDGGENWKLTTQSTPINDLFGFQLAISPNYGQDQTVVLASAKGLFITEDAAKTWRELTVISDYPQPDIRGVAISSNYANDKTILASVRGKGLYKSTDGGQSFANVGDNSLGISKVESIPYAGVPLHFSPNYAQDQTIFGIGSAKTEVFRSTDGGNNWEVLSVPVNDHNQYDFWTQLRVRAIVYRRHLAAIVLAALAALLGYFFIGYTRIDKKLPLNKVQLQAISCLAIFLMAFFAVEKLL